MDGAQDKEFNQVMDTALIVQIMIALASMAGVVIVLLQGRVTSARELGAMSARLRALEHRQATLADDVKRLLREVARLQGRIGIMQEDETCEH